MIPLESKKGLLSKAEELKHPESTISQPKNTQHNLSSFQSVEITQHKSVKDATLPAGHNEIAPDFLKDTKTVVQPFQKRVFIYFTLANMILNYDTGVIPASLLQIQEEIHLDHQMLAAIGCYFDV